MDSVNQAACRQSDQGWAPRVSELLFGSRAPFQSDTRGPPTGVAVNHIPVLHIDERMVAVDKPAGVPVHGTRDPHRPHLIALVATQLEVDAGTLHPVHRLDAPTTGVVVIARDPKTAEHLGAAFRTRTAKKLYLALCERGIAPPSEPWREDNHLRPAKGPRSRPAPMQAVRAGGRRAITDFECLADDAKHCLIAARPETGRRHQIRAHLAGCELPIVGDALYGATPADRLHLHAAALALLHPDSNERLHFVTPPPSGFFGRCPGDWQHLAAAAMQAHARK